MRKHLLIVLLLVSLAGIASELKQAIDRRKAGDLSQAERLLRDYSSPANFEQLSYPDKIAFMRGLLELAHVRALKDDVPGALALLNWAEGHSDDYLRAIACVKYAEILIDLGEFERAEGYLKNADEVFVKRVTSQDTDDGIAIGQGGETVDSGAAWRELRDESDALKADIEAETMKKKFGATYGNYVKLRRLQRLAKRSRVPRYLNEALAVADEIIDIDPASQFAAAAGYLKGEILASRLTETTTKDTKDAKKYLEKFVKTQPDGLYRGEVLMLLGKISLEVEWNARDAEKYYAQALDYFRKAREKRDAVSLYAAINDDLKKQTRPTRRLTSLNEWQRTIYQDEDPLKLYNTVSSPNWYISDKEKDCVFALGLMAFANGKYDTAREYWNLVKGYSPETAAIDARLPTTIHRRLLKACDLKAMAFWPEEKESIRGPDMRLKIQYAEYLILLARFSDAVNFFENILKTAKNDNVKAVAMVGIAHTNSLWYQDTTHKKSLSTYKRIIDDKKLQKTAIYGRAVMEYGRLHMAISGGYKKAIPVFEEYLKMFKNGRYEREAQYRIACCHIMKGEINKAEAIYEKLKNGKDAYGHFLKNRIENYRKNKK